VYAAHPHTAPPAVMTQVKTQSIRRARTDELNG